MKSLLAYTFRWRNAQVLFAILIVTLIVNMCEHMPNRKIKSVSNSESPSNAKTPPSKQNDSCCLNDIFSSPSNAYRNDSKVQAKIITPAQLETILLQECSGRIENKSFWRIELPGNKSMSLDEYKQWQAFDFIRRKANPGENHLVPPMEREYKDDNNFLSKNVLRNWKEDINLKEIVADVEREKRKRLKLNDDDILQIPEVKEEVFNSQYKVPNIIHFVWFTCRRMGVVHYMAMLGALKYQKPRIILIHGDCPPSGEYWEHLKKQAGDKIRFIKRTQPKQVWGIPVNVIEHRSDVARIRILMEVGGIYLDTDSFVLRNFDSLRNHSMLMPEECSHGLANSVIFANRDAWFLRRWYHEYRYFKDGQWSHNSVKVPWALWKKFPDKIYVIKKLIGRPNWKELGHIYWALYDWHSNYIMHIYSRFMMKMDHTNEHTLKELAILNTTFGEMSRHILWGDEKARDITDWIVSCNQTQGLLD